MREVDSLYHEYFPKAEWDRTRRLLPDSHLFQYGAQELPGKAFEFLKTYSVLWVLLDPKDVSSYPLVHTWDFRPKAHHRS